jgi:hypothetical protein
VRDVASAKQSAISVHKLPTTNQASGEWLPARRCNAAGKRKIPEPRMPLMPRPKQSISVSWRTGRVTSRHYPPVPRRARAPLDAGLPIRAIADHTSAVPLDDVVWSTRGSCALPRRAPRRAAGRRVRQGMRHARQTTITVASSHARTIPAAKALRAVGRAFSRFVSGCRNSSMSRDGEHLPSDWRSYAQKPRP